ncbi:hypothetical protein DKX38_017801 [Salix brachista]|uniref:Uncharacterized protein n=1 Tax=Salix brachista TaxID=2182728 RepID=A0A5N5KW66_9ROSI|nr:hypothetical protein DKX38_017801 [Salix brachista]
MHPVSIFPQNSKTLTVLLPQPSLNSIELSLKISTQPSILHNSSSEIIIIFISGSVLSSSDSSSSILNLNNAFSDSSDHTPQAEIPCTRKRELDHSPCGVITFDPIPLTTISNIQLFIGRPVAQMPEKAVWIDQSFDLQETTPLFLEAPMTTITAQ